MKNIENQQIKSEVTHNSEQMTVPEIIIQGERGIQLLSLLLKADNPGWGETNTSFANEVSQYIENHPLDPLIMESIKDIKEQGIDEETLYIIALTYKHSERVASYFEMTAKYKPHIKDPEMIYKKVVDLLEYLDNYLSISPLENKFSEFYKEDKSKRIENLDETKKVILEIINFYKPKINTSPIKKLALIQTDPLYKENSGYGFLAFPGEQIIISHRDNILNLKHEFSHGIINPVVEKLFTKLSKQEKEVISKLASKQLKDDYGSESFSLLCEELIRTYTELIDKGNSPTTIESIRNQISTWDDNYFKELIKNNFELKNRLSELKISTLADFKNKLEDYYDKYLKNELRDIIFSFYQSYINRSDQAVNFEQYLLDNFQNLLQRSTEK